MRERVNDESVEQAPLVQEEGWHRFGDGLVGDSNRNCNVLFKDESGTEADSQIHAFEDTWHLNHSAEETYHEPINQPDEVGRMIDPFANSSATTR